jgi:hypothetical protein
VWIKGGIDSDFCSRRYLVLAMLKLPFLLPEIVVMVMVVVVVVVTVDIFT